MSDKIEFPEISGPLDEIENNKLRRENLELRTKMQGYEKLLQENGLLEKLSQVSDAELVCNQQIAKFRELSDKGVPFAVEDTKNFEILVKTLLAVQGKAPVMEEKKKKGTEKVDVATLLKLASSREE